MSSVGGEGYQWWKLTCVGDGVMMLMMLVIWIIMVRMMTGVSIDNYDE